MAVVGILNHRGEVRLRVLEFFFVFKIKLSKRCSIKKERNTSFLLYHTFQQLRQDLPKLMIPQELSTSYGIKLMLANLWDAELGSSLRHMVNFIIQKRLQQKIWTLWNNLEWGEWEGSANQCCRLELCHWYRESCSLVKSWKHLVIQVVSSPTLRFCDTWCQKLSAWGYSLLWSFAFKPGSGSFRELCLLFGHLSPSLKG